MTLIIVFILLLCYFLIATENITNINKAATAIFAGTVGWVLYIFYGTNFVMSQHPDEYIDFLAGASPTNDATYVEVCDLSPCSAVEVFPEM